MNTQTQDILYIIIIHISSPDFRPTSAGSVTDCFKKAKEPLFFPNLCVQGKMTSMVIEDEYIYCRNNYESANCRNLLGNREQTIQLYNLCLDEMFQDQELQAAATTGMRATSYNDCDIYSSAPTQANNDIVVWMKYINISLHYFYLLQNVSVSFYKINAIG